MDCYTYLKKTIKNFDFKITFFNLWENIGREHTDICFFIIGKYIFNMCGKHKNYNRHYYSITLINFMIEFSYKSKI